MSMMPRWLVASLQEAGLLGPDGPDGSPLPSDDHSLPSDAPRPREVTEADLPSNQRDNIVLPSEGGPTEWRPRPGRKS